MQTLGHLAGRVAGEALEGHHALRIPKARDGEVNIRLAGGPKIEVIDHEVTFVRDNIEPHDIDTERGQRGAERGERARTVAHLNPDRAKDGHTHPHWEPAPTLLRDGFGAMKVVLRACVVVVI